MSIFAKQAKKEGYEQIAAIFTETAQNEREHAKRFFRFLEGGMVEIAASFPAGTIGTTLENLKAAAYGEHEEWNELYPQFARIARDEGFDDIAQAFTLIARVERAHEQRYRKLADNLEQGTVFRKNGVYIWKCRNCGYLHEASEAPESCPACLHPKAYFELQSNNY